MLKHLILILATIFAASCASAPAPANVVPFEVVQGKIVHLWSVSAERGPTGIKVSGYAARRLTPNGPVSEHLHVDAIGGGGIVLQSKPVPWNSFVSLRSKKSTSFNTEFDDATAPVIASVRLAIVQGAIHKDGE